ncbi:MAG: DUF2244 domain-containing protein [bacterium]
MPYQWLPPAETQSAHLRLWPYRSLPRRGFVWFISATCILLTLPLFSQLGTAGLWVLLPFLMAAVAGIWLALESSYTDGRLTEDLCFYPDRITLDRHNPRSPAQSWSANPHWVRVTLHATGGPVPFYLTLTGNQREVELGAFLTIDERRQLYDMLLKRLRTPANQPPNS